MQEYTQILTNYKEHMQDDPIIARIKILKAILSKKKSQITVSQELKIWKNTVNNLVALYKKQKGEWDDEIILNSSSATLSFLRTHFTYLNYKSRAPESHSRSIDAWSELGKRILAIHKDTNKGYKNMHTFLERIYSKEEYKKLSITLAKVRWFYKRNKLIHKKIKSENREYRSPFDFQNTRTFSRLYIDTKHIADAHALPPEVYAKFKYGKWKDGKDIVWLPRYELNILEQNTRVRFIAYLTELDSNLVRWFIEFVLLFIRGNMFLEMNEEIIVGLDGGMEFFSASERKQELWNEHFTYLNTKFYCYNWPKDTRKNLIERSHLSDDSEFYIPRWYEINSKNDFLKEAEDWGKYWNFERVHSGRYMYNLTPVEKARKLGVYNIKALTLFPMNLILQDHYNIFHNLKKSQYVLTQDLFNIYC